MKLQISFDMSSLENALAIAKDVEPYCDQFEIGSLMLYAHGAAAINSFRSSFPSKTIVADAKIIDRGAEAVELMAQAGADWVTIMGGTSRNVIQTAARAAQQYKVKLMIDLIDTAAHGQVAMESQALGVHAIVLHKPHDESDTTTFLDQWDLVKGNSKLPLFISASITRSTIQHILALKPDGIIISGAITLSNNPAQEAEYFYNLCNNHAA